MNRRSFLSLPLAAASGSAFGASLRQGDIEATRIGGALRHVAETAPSKSTPEVKIGRGAQELLRQQSEAQMGRPPPEPSPDGAAQPQAPALPQGPTSPLPPMPPRGLVANVGMDAELRNHPKVLAYVEFKDKATVLSDMGRSNWSDPHHRAWFAIRGQPDGSAFICEYPEFINYRGLPFLRFAGKRDIMAANLYAGRGVRHAFCRYVFVIEPDVMRYMTELGVKLPGFAGAYEDNVIRPPHAGTQWFSWRMEHGPKEGSRPNNPPLSWRDYLYDAAHSGDIKEYGGAFPVGVPITIEQEVDIDRKHGNIWIDGKPVGSRPLLTDVDIEMLFLNFYHGGMGFATQPIHYRVAAACIAREYIGVPKELRREV